jgi:hypothetical protein
VPQDSAVRVASWAYVLCAVLVAVAIFLPSLDLRVGGGTVSKRTERSLHQVSGDRALIHRMLIAYHRSDKRKIGTQIVRAVTPRVHGRPHAALEDARDAMDTLDDVTDDDIKHAGTALAITLWAMIGLEALLVVLVFSQLMRGVFRRWRMVLALLGALVIAAVAIALHLVLREAVWQVNDEVSHTILVLGPGAYALPIAAIAALIAAVVLVARRPAPPMVRSRAR